MGIYDREYYRDERSSFLGSLNRQGQVWKTLIFINVIVFILQLASSHRGVDGRITDWFQIDTQAILHGEVWRLLTGAFLHSREWQHIVFNMLILWWAGSEVEGIYGPREFLAFYLTAAVVASAAFVGWDVFFGAGQAKALGASGAVTATLVLFALHYPNRTVLLFFIVPVPVLVLVILYVAFDALNLLGGSREPIAFAAHLGGAAFGFLYYKFHWRITNLWPSNWSFSISRPRPKLRVYRGEPYRERPPEPVSAPASARPVRESDLEAELDAVLAKVASQGKSSLTEREQQILMRASEIYRNRRK
jgi:membrane associated rhomboid family serine protease